MMTIHYLGPEGTFSELAARETVRLMAADARFSTCDFVPHRTLASAMAAIGEATDDNAFAVVPYYNLIEGLIQETLDLLIEHDLTVSAALQLPVRFAIGGFVHERAASISRDKTDASKNSVEEQQGTQTPNIGWPITTELPVFSHPKGLAQCSFFLQRNVPAATQHESTSTSQAVRQVAENHFGLAIARRETLEQFGLPVLCDDIGNRLYTRRNYTEFLFVGRTDATTNAAFTTAANTKPNNMASRKKRTLLAIIPAVDRVGLLADILGQIAFFGINLLKIHSRPAPADDDGPAPQMFYLETDVSSDSSELRLCLDTLEMRLAGQATKHGVVRILGAYDLHAID